MGIKKFTPLVVYIAFIIGWIGWPVACGAAQIKAYSIKDYQFPAYGTASDLFQRDINAKYRDKPNEILYFDLIRSKPNLPAYLARYHQRPRR